MKIDLNGTWQMSGEKIGTVPATIPGTVLSTLLENKIIDDPYFRDNENAIREQYLNSDYTFSRRFCLTQEQLKQSNYLFIDGIDTVATVLVNGTVVANCLDMHLPQRVELPKDILQLDNEIVVKITSPYTYVENYPNNGNRFRTLCNECDQRATRLRKAHYMFGWDWGPDLADMGIWKDIYIISTNVGYLQNFRHKCIFNDDGTVTVKVQTSYKLVGQGNICVALSLPSSATGQVVSKRLHETNEFEFVVTNPQLWYPNGFGAQPLYNLEIAVKGEEQQNYYYQIGLRKIVIDDAVDEIGHNFAVYVNDKKVFLKGGDYIPQDNLITTVTPKRTKKLLQLCKDFNHNVIRVWGGGYYPSDDFYQTCDKLGLLVFQDLMFACSTYNADDVAFMDLVKQETVANLQRIRHHACLLLISGNNENEQLVAPDWVVDGDTIRSDYVRLYYDTLQPIVEQQTDLFYLPSSPTSGKVFDDPNNQTDYDMHYWEVWHGKLPFENYTTLLPRMMTEFGCQSFPLYQTVISYANSDELDINSAVIDHHQKNKSCNEKILFYLESLFGKAKDFCSIVQLSMYAQAEGIKMCAEHLRRNKYRCNGVLYWQLNDSWPGQTWSSLDYYYGVKALHYFSRRFYAPSLISIRDNGNTLGVNVSNDTDTDNDYTVTCKHVDFFGNEISCKTITTTVDKASDKDVITLNNPFENKPNTVLYVQLCDGNGNEISSNYFQPVKDKDVTYPKPNLTVNKIDDYTVEIATDVYTKFICLDTGNYGDVWDDNYFHLLAGQKHVVKCNNKIDFDKLTVTSLFDYLY